MRRYVWGIVQATVSLGLLVWLFRSLDQHAFRKLASTLPLWYYVASLSVVLLGQALYAWRWWLLLMASGVTVSLSTALRLYFVGIFVNNFLPGTVGGDVAKVYYLGREHGHRPIVATIVVDRLLGVGILAALAASAAWLVPAVSPRLVASRIAVTGIAAALIMIVVLAVFGTGGLTRCLAPFGRHAVSIGARAQRLRLEMANLLKHSQVIGLGVAVVLAYFVALTVLYVWFGDLSHVARPPFMMTFVVVATTALLSHVPISLNGLGVREQLHVWLLAPLGVPGEVALAISLLLFAHLMVASTIGLLFWRWAPTARRVRSDEAIGPAR